ncbi:MAG: hypothetical protein ACR2PL_09805 [Dehalococcoidia bacterium]
MVDAVRRAGDGRQTDTLERFMADVEQSLQKTGLSQTGCDRLGQLMHGLVTEGNILQPEDLQRIEAGQKSGRLYASSDGGLTLVLGRFPADRPTRVHNHGSWGVACIYAGRDRYTAWHREDPGDGPGPARLTRLDEQILSRGDYVSWPGPPQDLHSQQGYDGETAWEFVLFGYDTMSKPRLYFDLASAEAWEGPVSELREPYPAGRSGVPAS